LKSLTLLDIFGCKSIGRSPNSSNTKILTDSIEAWYWKRYLTGFVRHEESQSEEEAEELEE
jgi:hypothetical protein